MTAFFIRERLANGVAHRPALPAAGPVPDSLPRAPTPAAPAIPAGSLSGRAATLEPEITVPATHATRNCRLPACSCLHEAAVTQECGGPPPLSPRRLSVVTHCPPRAGPAPRLAKGRA